MRAKKELNKQNTITEDAFVEYNIIIFKKKNISTFILLALVLTLLFIYFNLLNNIIISVFVGIAMGVAFYFLTYHLAYNKTIRKAKSTYEKEKLSEVKLTYSANKESITQKHGNENFKFTWDKIKYYLVTDHAYYLFYTKNDALIFCKENTLEEEMQQLESYFELNNINKK